MTINKAYPFPLLVFLIALIVYSPNAYANPSGGGTTAVSVADAVHSAAGAASLSEEFNRIMGDYETEVSKEGKEVLLNRAKAILTQLIEQANNVESEISIISKKKTWRSKRRYPPPNLIPLSFDRITPLKNLTGQARSSGF